MKTKSTKQALKELENAMDNQKQEIWLEVELDDNEAVISAAEKVRKLNDCREITSRLKAILMDTEDSESVIIPFGGIAPESTFNVAAEFPECHPDSIAIAQGIVDVVCRLDDLEGNPIDPIRRTGRDAIGFSLNFIEIESINKRRAGVRVCLYGKPEEYTEFSPMDARRRGVYSGKTLNSLGELDGFLAILRHAYEMKCARAMRAA